MFVILIIVPCSITHCKFFHVREIDYIERQSLYYTDRARRFILLAYAYHATIKLKSLKSQYHFAMEAVASDINTTALTASPHLTSVAVQSYLARPRFAKAERLAAGFTLFVLVDAVSPAPG